MIIHYVLLQLNAVKSSWSISSLSMECISILGSLLAPPSEIDGMGDISCSLYIDVLLTHNFWSPCLRADQWENSGQSQAVIHCILATVIIA